MKEQQNFPEILQAHPKLRDFPWTTAHPVTLPHQFMTVSPQGHQSIPVLECPVVSKRGTVHQAVATPLQSSSTILGHRALAISILCLMLSLV